MGRCCSRSYSIHLLLPVSPAIFCKAPFSSFPFCSSHPLSAPGQVYVFLLFLEDYLICRKQVKLCFVSLPGPQTWLLLVPGSLFPRCLALHAARLPGCQLRPLFGGSVMCLVVLFPSSRCHLASCSQTRGRMSGQGLGTWGHAPGHQCGEGSKGGQKHPCPLPAGDWGFAAEHSCRHITNVVHMAAPGWHWHGCDRASRSSMPRFRSVLGHSIGCQHRDLPGKGGSRFGSKVGAAHMGLFPADASSATGKPVICLEREGWRLADAGKCMQRC